MGGVGPASRTDLLPVTRLIVIVLMLGSFALAFAQLVRQSEETSLRPQPAASRCGDAAGTPCPQRAL
ncbi:conserved hypothetical protein [Mesorhizobium escarrei]|uniref:Uncharacterized protein n=1 Tax=Mesorhizobium escarrei TaxID=666018 RepID=A0ABM9DSG4_9HYPH|nr:conserved hypothetical protein [Mesorhizobium escarrei]